MSFDTLFDDLQERKASFLSNHKERMRELNDAIASLGLDDIQPITSQPTDDHQPATPSKESIAAGEALDDLLADLATL